MGICRLNQGADILSRNNVAPGEWNLNPQTVQMIWSVFGKAEVDLFASRDNCHCPTYFSKQRDAHDWPNTHLYAFPPIAQLPQVIRRIMETKCSLLLVTPPLEEPSLVPRDDPAAVCSTVVNATEERSSLANVGQDLASPDGTVESSCLAARRESNQLPAKITNTFKRLELHLHLHLHSTPSSGQSSVTGVQHVTRIWFHVMCPTC